MLLNFIKHKINTHTKSTSDFLVGITIHVFVSKWDNSRIIVNKY